MWTGAGYLLKVQLQVLLMDSWRLGVRGVREDGSVMRVVVMTPLKGLLSFRPLQLTAC